MSTIFREEQSLRKKRPIFVAFRKTLMLTLVMPEHPLKKPSGMAVAWPSESGSVRFPVSDEHLRRKDAPMLVTSERACRLMDVSDEHSERKFKPIIVALRKTSMLTLVMPEHPLKKPSVMTGACRSESGSVRFPVSEEHISRKDAPMLVTSESACRLMDVSDEHLLRTLLPIVVAFRKTSMLSLVILFL
jgi:hypothetical protein